MTEIDQLGAKDLRRLTRTCQVLHPGQGEGHPNLGGKERNLFS
jgi:hypothetical protein